MTVIAQNTCVGPVVPWPAISLRRRGVVLGAVLVLHGGLLAFALGRQVAPEAAMVPLPMSVRFISERSAPLPQAAPLPPLPLPQRPLPQRPLKTPPPRPQAMVPTPAPVAAPVLAAAPTAAASSSFAVSERPALPSPAPAVTQARFDADYLHNPKPVYPGLSRRLGEEGKVQLKVQVTAQGTAEQVEIHHSSGFPRLDQAARDAVWRWRFVPARRGDEPVAASVIVPITFALEG